jgi:tRNA A-37 threonylcarbamoyl transferase component Bud32
MIVLGEAHDMSSPSSDTDRNLLFGVLAMQLDLIDARQFADACSAWSLRKQTSLADVLAEHGWLTPADRDQVEKLLERKLKKHGGNVRASLGAAADARVRDVIRSVDDAELRQTCSILPPAAGYVLLTTTAPTKQQRSRYSLTRIQGEGGLGRVWVAVDEDLNREVALKEIRAEKADHPTAWRRLLKEAQVTGQLEHPNIVPVYELARGAENDKPFYTMRLVRGQTLRAAIADYHERRRLGKEDPLDRPNLLNAFVSICQAIGYAHSRGVLHRDLKPDNVVLGDYGVVMVLDWGLARLVDQPEEAAEAERKPAISPEAQTEATQAGSQLGTPAYMAPEQAEGRSDLIETRTDIYGLGTILYEILTGRAPHDGPDTASVYQKIIHGATPRVRAAEPTAPQPLDAVCARAMAHSRRDRYATASELAEDVKRWLNDQPVSCLAEPLLVKAGRFARRNRTLVTSAAAALIVAVVSLSVAAVLLAAANDKLDVAFRQEREAKDLETKARYEADENAEKERQARQAEEAAKEQEKKARQEADENAAKERKARQAEEAANRVATSQADLAYDALGDLVLKIQIDLDEAPGGRHVRKELLEDTMKKLHRLHESPATTDRLYRRYASAHMQLGEILWNLNRRAEAEVEYKKAGEYAERAFAANPTSDKAKANIAANHNRMGDTELFYHKNLEPARKLYEAAVPLWEGLAKKMAAFPDGDPALPELERINLVDCEEAVADTYDRMGIVALRFDFDYPKAEEWFNKSRAIRERHLKTHPSRQHRVAIGASLIYLAEWALQHNELDKAISLHEELLKQREGTFAERRWSLKARRELADAQGKLGDDLMLAKRNDEGHKLYLASRDLFQQVMAAEPDDPIYRGLVAHAHYRCGTSFLRVGDPKGARHAFEEGLKLRRAVYDETMDERQKINMQPQFMLAVARAGKHEEAAELAASVRKNLGMMPIHLAEAGSCYGICMASVGEGKPVDQLTPEEKKLRQEYLRLALACFEEARQKKYDDILFLEKDADFDLLHGTPEYEAWLESFRRSLQAQKGSP